jgi:hypothetical protein
MCSLLLGIDHIDMPATLIAGVRTLNLHVLVAVGASNYLHHMTVRVIGTDTAATVQMIDLAGHDAPRTMVAAMARRDDVANQESGGEHLSVVVVRISVFDACQGLDDSEVPVPERDARSSSTRSRYE